MIEISNPWGDKEIRRERRDAVDGLPFPVKSAQPRPQAQAQARVMMRLRKRELEPMLLSIGDKQTTRSKAMIQSAVFPFLLPAV